MDPGRCIGEVREVDAWVQLTLLPWGHEGWSSQWVPGPKETPPVPGKTNWDLWLGRRRTGLLLFTKI